MEDIIGKIFQIALTFAGVSVILLVGVLALAAIYMVITFMSDPY